VALETVTALPSNGESSGETADWCMGQRVHTDADVSHVASYPDICMCDLRLSSVSIKITAFRDARTASFLIFYSVDRGGNSQKRLSIIVTLLTRILEVFVSNLDLVTS
jgi:hypothetical protein